MTLITTTEDLKSANSAVVHDLNFESIQSFVGDASINDMIPAIGRPAYIFIGTGGDDEAISIARQLAQKAEANLAIAYYVNFGSVQLGENGAHVYQDDHYRIASDKKIAVLGNQARMDGYRALEGLLAYMETERNKFPVYLNSDERKANLSNFINFTAEFNEALDIGKNVLLFRSLKSYIQDAEVEHIEPLLGDEYTALLRAKILEGNCNPTERQLLKQIAKVVSQFAIAEAIPYRAVSLDANGIFINTVGVSAGGANTERQTTAELSRLQLAMHKALCNGRTNVDRLRKFISKNKDALTGCKPVILNTSSTLNDQGRGFVFV
jgi:hypothetical protein